MAGLDGGVTAGEFADLKALVHTLLGKVDALMAEKAPVSVYTTPPARSAPFTLPPGVTIDTSDSGYRSAGSFDPDDEAYLRRNGLA